MNIRCKLIAFLKDESGPTSVEYAIMIAFIVLFCAQTLRLIGQGAATQMQRNTDAINSVINP